MILAAQGWWRRFLLASSWLVLAAAKLRRRWCHARRQSCLNDRHRIGSARTAGRQPTRADVGRRSSADAWAARADRLTRAEAWRGNRLQQHAERRKRMSDILFQYHKVDPTTWVYLSSLLTIGLFFKFSRLLSVRNLDLIGLILLAPGSAAGRIWPGQGPAGHRAGRLRLAVCRQRLLPGPADAGSA